ncbi:hypothetical protein RJ639_045747 [Escallonia herrerae]|uniref:Uncharacterized protein n=1 Tax=Escallonia herrerae TaxID=1293975 RepID=A0AA88W5W1_9ASTE|nr:hypothetical protein RJ639_045747 [Escallonia herrerae]
MEVERNCCGAVALERMVCSVMEGLVIETAVAVQRSIIGSLPNDIEAEKRFPFGDVNRVTKPDAENNDASETEDDSDDEDEDSDDSDDDDDADADDFPGGADEDASALAQHHHHPFKRLYFFGKSRALGIKMYLGTKFSEQQQTLGGTFTVQERRENALGSQLCGLGMYSGVPAVGDGMYSGVPVVGAGGGQWDTHGGGEGWSAIMVMQMEAPRLGHAGAGHGRLDGLLVLLDAAHAVANDGLGLEGEDGVGVEVVEAEAEGGAAGGELGGGAVEEHVLLDVGFDVVGEEQVGDFPVGGGVRQLELYLHLHLACVRARVSYGII